MTTGKKSHTTTNRMHGHPDSSQDQAKASARQKTDAQQNMTARCVADQSQQPPGFQAVAGGKTLRSYTVGALPIANSIIHRLKLPDLLKQHLPKDPRRTLVPTHRALLVLLRNMLFSREPIYGIGEWAERHAPDLLDLWITQVSFLNDDRLGRCLDRLFVHAGPELVLRVTQQAIEVFQLSLDELHNDSTTITFHGAYSQAEEEGRMQGRATPAITWGHNKDHRPDLKQLLFILTVTNDGGVPVYFQSTSGNVTDDQTHQHTWNLLRELVGRADFLYVADCKLATSENMSYIAAQGGRFVSVLPRTRKEDTEFRQRLRTRPGSFLWNPLYDITNDQGEIVDQLTVCADTSLTSEGFHLYWYHSTRKAQLDATRRAHKIQRAISELIELRQRLQGPRTRYRQWDKVESAVQSILEEHQVQEWLIVTIDEHEEASFRQAQPGRPTKTTRYRKETKLRYTIDWETDGVALKEAAEEDGVFPLISNELQLSAEDVLRAYKRQPLIEKRFSQFKNDFSVAPIFLKNVGRIQALLMIYYLVLLVQTLLERELRQAMQAADKKSIRLYPERRKCSRPTTRRLLDVFEPVQRHTLVNRSGREETYVTELSPVQLEILELLGINADTYGH